MSGQGRRWGLYEKALPEGGSWEVLLAGTAAAGYQFLELSIDESDERLARLEWPAAERRRLRAVLAGSAATIDTLCLSAHRRFPLGSASRPVRERGLQIMRRAVDFAAESGARLILVAGYDVFYEPSTERTRALYLEGLRRAAEWAASASVMLGLENVDCPLVDSVTKALRFVEAVDTPWLQLYPDVANLAAMGYDPAAGLRAAGRHLVGLHLKDGRPGEIRRVPFGEGIVDFAAVFHALHAVDYRGPFVVEMWCDGAQDAVATAARAREWLAARTRGRGPAFSADPVEVDLSPAPLGLQAREAPSSGTRCGRAGRAPGAASPRGGP